MNPANANEAWQLMVKARRPKPDVDDMLKLAGLHAACGDAGFRHRTALPEETIADLTRLGFVVDDDRQTVWWHDDELSEKGPEPDGLDRTPGLPKRRNKRKTLG
jgi:hypothetical protein